MNAAIVLARCRRNILLFDSGTYRNRRSHGMHNYLTRDDVAPMDFVALCRKELKKYKVQLSTATIRGGKKNNGLFEIQDNGGNTYFSKYLLVATGVLDNIPEVEGFQDMYGKSVFHCPYCDGWEVRDRKLGVYARDKNGSELALALKGWSPHVTLYTDGKPKIKPQEAALLEANNIPVVRSKVRRLEGQEGKLKYVVFESGDKERCDAIFFVNGYHQQCDLAAMFGCEINKKGVVVTDRFQQTNIDGLYVAGDASKDMHFVVVAAAEGAKAGVIINKRLVKEHSEENKTK